MGHIMKAQKVCYPLAHFVPACLWSSDLLRPISILDQFEWLFVLCSYIMGETVPATVTRQSEQTAGCHAGWGFSWGWGHRDRRLMQWKFMTETVLNFLCRLLTSESVKKFCLFCRNMRRRENVADLLYRRRGKKRWKRCIYSTIKPMYCVWACWLLFERSLILMTFLRGFVMGPTDAWRALHHTQQKHGDTQSGTCLLIDATPLPICIASVCVCVGVFVLHLTHFVLVTHLISQTFDAECKRDTYWHAIRSEQCVLLQLITVSYFSLLCSQIWWDCRRGFNCVIDLAQCHGSSDCFQFNKVVVWDSVL